MTHDPDAPKAAPPAHADASDDAFDRALSETLLADHGDVAPLSRAVLTRLADPGARDPARGPADVLVAPLPLGLGLAGALLAAVATGYFALPTPDLAELTLLHLIGDLSFLGEALK